ncbi:hypothetical protein TD95_000946 [Thielaviopsis punctulata]|uniref:Palmitoyltransferase n=1 Tax=Thielaviopsis punctulata TaxID=72032 RepID=A0A0F4ZG89_9PEZI|nr:hypothetical protein TD95_000946 [Thielaviopsis punctulata]
MTTLRKLLIAILVVIFAVFVIFFGRLPALRNTPISALNRLLVVKVPAFILWLDNAVTGGRFGACLVNSGSFLVNERHPLVLIFFVVVMLGSEYMFLPAAWQYMSTVNRVCGPIAVIMPYVFLYLASFTDPGFITPETHVYYMAQYPYDFSIFHPGNFCHTCRLLKPARSKHCSVCKCCVSKMDHHCVFLNQCVGQKNHRYFIMLLLSTAVLTTYGGLLGCSILTERVVVRYPLWSLWKPGSMSWNDYFVILGWALERNTFIGAVALLAILCSPMVWMFLFYTLFLVYCGTTTNESLKWADWKVEIGDGVVYRRSMSLAREKYLNIEPAVTRWPTETEQILTRVEDGHVPDPNFPGRGEWERVDSLRDVDNLYDLGFADNMRDIFYRDYPFKDKYRERELQQAKNGLPPFENATRRRKRRAKAAAI